MGAKGGEGLAHYSEINWELANAWHVKGRHCVWASLVAQLVKNPPTVQETPVWFLGQEDPLGRDRLCTPIFMGFLGGSAGKESACNVGDLGLIPVLGRSPGGGHSNPLRYSCLENPCGWRSLAGYSAWGHKELDTTEWLNTGQHHLTALNIGCVRTTAADSRTADYIYFAMCRHSSLPGPLGTTVIMMQFISLASFTLRNPAHVPIGGYLCQGIDLEGRS